MPLGACNRLTRVTRRRTRAASWAALATSLVAIGAPVARAEADESASPAEQLAQRHAPVVMVPEHTAECGGGEPYAPVAVESVLGRDDVVLRAADGSVLAQAPTAADLYSAPADSQIDIPGNALSPGCDYERWFRGSPAAVQAPTVYARVATDPDEPGRLAVQYWLWWVYNDWNDRHEGDWEMLQVVFDAATPEEALGRAPTEVAVAQHEGSERREWSRVQLDGDRPVVFPARGSHATYYTANRWFGKSAASGFGCDDTRAPSTRLDPAVVMLPDEVTGADDPFAWLRFEGRWGERQPTFNNGPTGPVTKDQWAHPLVWMEEEGRTGSVSLPPTGTKVTDFFCTASTAGSLLFIRFLDRPWLVAAALAAGVALVVWGVRRTLWSPDLPLPLMARRRNGQVLRAAARLMWEQRRRFRPISLLALAGGLAAAAAQALVMRIPAIDTLGDIVGKGEPLGVTVALAAGALVSIPVGVVVVSAATRLAVDLDDGIEQESTEGALRRGWRAAPIGSATVLALLVVLLPVLPIVSLVLLTLWCVSPLVAQADGVGVGDSLRAARRLTKGRRFNTALLLFVAAAVALLTGPFVGTLVLLVSSASFVAVNVVAALFAAVLLPWLAVVLALLHGDLAARGSAPVGGVLRQQ